MPLLRESIHWDKWPKIWEISVTGRVNSKYDGKYFLGMSKLEEMVGFKKCQRIR